MILLEIHAAVAVDLQIEKRRSDPEVGWGWCCDIFDPCDDAILPNDPYRASIDEAKSTNLALVGTAGH